MGKENTYSTPKLQDGQYVIPESMTSFNPDCLLLGGDTDVCVKATSLLIHDSLTSICQGAFSHFTSLESFSVSKGNPGFTSEDGILYNKDKSVLIAFPARKAVENFVVPETVTRIGDKAFAGCKRLKSVRIPESVTEIGDGAFMDCSGIEQMDALGSITEISLNTFMGCEGMVSVAIPETVTRIGRSSFAYCSSLRNVTIPESVTEIDDDAFCDTALRSVTLLASVKKIGGGAFSCPWMEPVQVSAENPCYCAVDGILYTKDMTELVAAPREWRIGDFSIPETVERIGDKAFFGCWWLTRLVIPDSVKEIGNRAFGFCTRLERVVIPDSVSSIGVAAFDHCESLFSASLPASLDRIQTATFGYCKNLDIVIVSGSSIQIDMLAFDGCEGLTRFFCRDCDIRTVDVTDSSFAGASINRCALIVGGDVDAYRAHPVFSKFRDVHVPTPEDKLIYAVFC